MLATVLRGTGGVWRVIEASGVERDATLRGRLKQESMVKLAVGDQVEIDSDERGHAWSISEIHPRRSALVRRMPGSGRGERVVVANIDQVVVVFAAAQPEPHPRMLDRFLVIAAANDVPAHIVINKIELVGAEMAQTRFVDYARAGYTLHFTSVKRGEGLAELHETLHGRISALSGPSGVGKSSLLNVMYPGLDLRVGEISYSVNKGRHTTVGADMHPLPDGGFVVDTPGLREVGVWGLSPEELDRCFLEFRPYLGECRFQDCRHRVEPECAVRAAIQRGEVTAARYDSYVKLYDELADLAARE